MDPYFVSERWEYDYIVSRGYEPLVDTKHFRMSLSLRKEVQREKFGAGHSPAENEKFYRWAWQHRTHRCEECLKPLEYSATYVSHILTRGAHPEMAHDPRNVNILCFAHHEMWEHDPTRKKMRIYPSNMLRIEELKKEYNDE